jgi:hypothetical protein
MTVEKNLLALDSVLAVIRAIYKTRDCGPGMWDAFLNASRDKIHVTYTASAGHYFDENFAWENWGGNDILSSVKAPNRTGVYRYPSYDDSGDLINYDYLQGATYRVRHQDLSYQEWIDVKIDVIQYKNMKLFEVESDSRTLAKMLKAFDPAIHGREVLPGNATVLDQGYLAMSEDNDREAEASEWVGMTLAAICVDEASGKSDHESAPDQE